MLTFWQGKYGEIVGGKDAALGELPSEFQPRLISFLLLTVGCAEIVGGVTFGRLSDRFGSSVVMVLGCALTCAAGVAMVYINFETSA